MTRETKINLGFLIAFLAISLPGAAILFVKKLAPNQRMMYEPVYVRKTEAYNNPQTATSGAIRVFPPKTMAWTAALTERDVGRPPLRLLAAGDRVQPVVSDGRRFELLDLVPFHGGGNDTLTVTLLFWSNDFTAGVESMAAVLKASDGSWFIDSASVTPVDVPAEVSEELRQEGFTQPPKRAGLVKLHLLMSPDDLKGAASPRLDLRWQDADGTAAADSLPLPIELLHRAALPAEAGAGKDVGRAWAEEDRP